MLYWPVLRPKQIVQAFGLRGDPPERAAPTPKRAADDSPGAAKAVSEPVKDR